MNVGGHGTHHRCLDRDTETTLIEDKRLRPLKLLFYVEALPIRDDWRAFLWIGEWWARLTSINSWDVDQVRFLANEPTREAIFAYGQKLGRPLSPEHFIVLSDATQAALQEFASVPWVTKGIVGWKALIAGQGPVAAAIEDELALIRATAFGFDAVVLWGLNGAVRRFCERNGVACQSGELGATRSPLPRALYFDPLGAHGDGLLPRSKCADLPVPDEVMEMFARGIGARKSESPIGMKRALIALQLADDANMLTIEGFEGPEHYLDWALPLLLGAGYEVVVKGHPHAADRCANAEVQERCLAKSLRTQGVSIMNVAPQGDHYLKWLASFDLVASISSSIVFEASLAGARTALERPASFAAADAMPNLEGALSQEFDWDAQRVRAVRNAAFYLGGFALFEGDKIGPDLMQVAELDRDLGYSKAPKDYLRAWGQRVSPRRLEGYQSVKLQYGL